MQSQIIKFLILGMFVCPACKSKSANANKNPNGATVTSETNASDTSKHSSDTAGFKYDLKNPDHTWKLPDQLVEVSGNTWIETDHLILIEDLHPNLYLIKLDDKTATLEKTIPFAEQEKDKVDIEDVAFIDNTVYALWSHGVLFKITKWQNKPQVDKINTGLDKINNTEGLCYDPVSKKLLIACKDDAGIPDEKKSAKAVYQFDMENEKLLTKPFMVIHKKDFEPFTGDKLSFNPSAIAVHPVTHDIYILTTRDNKGMAVFTHDGILKSYQTIEKELMPQPEGICFSPEGKLYISSEGKKGEAGNLFEFDVQKQ
ncbi:MAG: SdiA-regulated domain-containing protein [Bacteroidota bacterium]|nr:SdiA-regulated domain-containing protein [Bacteroidota bacterium]